MELELSHFLFGVKNPSNITLFLYGIGAINPPRSMFLFLLLHYSYMELEHKIPTIRDTESFITLFLYGIGAFTLTNGGIPTYYIIPIWNWSSNKQSLAYCQSNNYIIPIWNWSCLV